MDLEGYVLKVRQGDAFSHVYNFENDAVIWPGERMVVWTAATDDVFRLDRTWGADVYILGDGGNAVDLRNLNDVLIDCDAWGHARC